MNRTEPEAIDENVVDLPYLEKKRLGLLTKEEVEAKRAEFNESATGQENTRVESTFDQNMIAKDSALVDEAKRIAKIHGIEFTDDTAEQVKLRFMMRDNGTVMSTGLHKDLERFLNSTQTVAIKSAQAAVDERIAKKESLYQQLIYFSTIGNQDAYRKCRAEYAKA